MAGEKNFGIYTNPEHDLYGEEVAMPKAPGENEVTVKIIACGICGSDVHYQKEGTSGLNHVEEPMILGHEAAGIIVAVGPNVKQHKVGDRVSVEPGTPCNVCENCITGHYNGCPTLQFKSCPGYPGLLQKYVNHPARLCYNIGDLSFEEGALLEPLSVALSGVRRSGLTVGEPTIVSGAGPIGVLTALVARAAGASPLLIVDINEARLDLAKKIVPGVLTHKTDLKLTPKETAKKLQEQLGSKAKRVIECTGNEAAISTDIFSMEFAATIVIIGVGADEVKVPINYISFNEMTVKSIFRYTNTWPTLIRMIQSGVLNVKDCVSFKYGYKDSKEAFEKAADPKSTGIKTMILMDQE